MSSADGTELGHLLRVLEDRLAEGRAAQAEVYKLKALCLELEGRILTLQTQLEIYRMPRGHPCGLVPP